MENVNKYTRRAAIRLCKMIRIIEDIDFVLKRIKQHQKDQSLKSLLKPFQFIENPSECHAEIAILNSAAGQCASKTLYIGLSKRPCYCCSLLF